MAIQIQLRHDTAANWTSVNPILALGERGVETDTGKEKSGDGSTVWTSLPYFGLTSPVSVANGGTGLTAMGTGVTTFLGTPSSANLATAITDETGSGSLVFATNPTLVGLKQTRVVMAANDIDLSTGDVFTKTISTTTTFTVSNIPATGKVASFLLKLTNGGSATITWWANMKWVGGIAPTLTTSGRDDLGFYTEDNGTTWAGFVLGKDIK